MSAVASLSPFLSALSLHWGYTSFRPGQEEIAASIAAGRDACVVMPTGGGKSLCYQLPAALAEDRTAIVISPLIALMQDQVAQLDEMGIPAAVLNSSQSSSQRDAVRRDALSGKFRLLYLSPESIAQEGTLRWLKSLALSFFVIDEAHCISEWGHDFRPEYRLLSRLRREFPALPIAAFTASATQHVRHDIVSQLGLRDPFKYIASFYRPNLQYCVRECSPAEQEAILLDALRSLEAGSAIVYSPTIRRVEDVVEFLKAKGIPAIGYHGKMDPARRRRNQELWSTDKVRVVVGTVAFGLGINKPGVRKVIHLALPKASNSFIKKQAGQGATVFPPNVCFSGKNATPPSSPTSFRKLKINRKKNAGGCAITRFANSSTIQRAANFKSVATSGNNPNGPPAVNVTPVSAFPLGCRRRLKRTRNSPLVPLRRRCLRKRVNR